MLDGFYALAPLQANVTKYHVCFGIIRFYLERGFEVVGRLAEGVKKCQNTKNSP